MNLNHSFSPCPKKSPVVSVAYFWSHRVHANAERSHVSTASASRMPRTRKPGPFGRSTAATAMSINHRCSRTIWRVAILLTNRQLVDGFVACLMFTELQRSSLGAAPFPAHFSVTD